MRGRKRGRREREGLREWRQVRKRDKEGVGWREIAGDRGISREGR